MTFYFAKAPLATTSNSADWAVQVLDQEKLVLLFINYTFFSIIVMTFILFLMCLSQASSITLDAHALMTILAICFIMVNLVVADYLVHAMNMNKELRLLY